MSEQVRKGDNMKLTDMTIEQARAVLAQPELLEAEIDLMSQYLYSIGLDEDNLTNHKVLANTATVQAAALAVEGPARAAMRTRLAANIQRMIDTADAAIAEAAS